MDIEALADLIPRELMGAGMTRDDLIPRLNDDSLLLTVDAPCQDCATSHSVTGTFAELMTVICAGETMTPHLPSAGSS